MVECVVEIVASVGVDVDNLFAELGVAQHGVVDLEFDLFFAQTCVFDKVVEYFLVVISIWWVYTFNKVLFLFY